jgi:sugar O-acyltransferase (sialic acid O-acetyltransferase NeuD family)
MKKRLIIIGAGGLGREVFSYLLLNPHAEWEVAGFLDDGPDPLAGYDLPAKVLGRSADYSPLVSDLFIPGIGDPEIKLRLCRGLAERGAKFATFFHPTALLGYRARVGVGGFIYPGAIIGPYATIGNFVSIGANATVGHDAKIGDGCTLCGHTEINGWTELGEGVFLGSHASALPKVKVGEYAKIGAGSVCFGSVKPHTTMMGVPAKKLLS